MDVRKFVDIDAGAARYLVLPELFEERSVAFETRHDVDRKIRLARREAGERPVALLPRALGFVVVRAVADDCSATHSSLLRSCAAPARRRRACALATGPHPRLTPHRWLHAGSILKNLEELHGVFPLLRIFHRLDKGGDATGVLFGFQFGHWRIVTELFRDPRGTELEQSSAQTVPMATVWSSFVG